MNADDYAKEAVSRGGHAYGVNLDALTPPVGPMSHKVFQRAITDFAERHGWDWHHQTISNKSKEGWPDVVLFRERIVAIEVKVLPDKPSAAQLRWLEIFRAAGATAFVAYPSDWSKVTEALK